MIKAVLLDLDNTLLHNPDCQWVLAFRQQWDRHFADCYGVNNASDALRKALACLNSTPEPYLTNAEVTLDGLAREMSLSKKEISVALTAFYEGNYNSLRARTSPIARAADLVEHLLNQNLLVAIATNPLFPEVATRQRLAWAGLSDFISDFAFITHSENMHFAKPAPAYFAETVARVGVEPDEALVVGDSLLNDIGPAESIGIHAWQVDEQRPLEAVIERVLESNWVNEFLPGKVQPGMLYPQFQGNLAALYGLLMEVKGHQWLMRPDPDEWSILQILCHLWKAETEVHQQRLRSILDEDNPFIPSLPPPGPHIPACHDNGIEVFERFRAQRRKTMDMLTDLTPEDWKRPARHSIFGLTNLLEMSYFTAQHDRLHITQLCQTLGKCAD